MKWLVAVNGLMILALLASVIWTAFAIGKPEWFDRMTVTLILQFVCIAFMAVRRCLRAGRRRES